MDELTINDIKIERAEFVSRLMIDADLSERDLKIGLCLLHEILLRSMNTQKANAESEC
ncbi:hypothetical protein [Gilliamella sp. N-G2]|uniref:hypothetical protein n=1 Tax=Gilliamella sp. N-G2 TaxID=1970471 RepID=UPI001302620C|nr:hypothetical protein [Gilliamella sp. N-G2]